MTALKNQGGQQATDGAVRRRPPNAGKGRKKGVPNKLTASAREAYQAAFEGLGGVQALTIWAGENPTEFYKQFARLIPVDVQATGDISGEIIVRWAPAKS